MYIQIHVYHSSQVLLFIYKILGNMLGRNMTADGKFLLKKKKKKGLICCTLFQYYAMLGGERYVDLGLGTHRVKCRVHRQFRFVPSGYFQSACIFVRCVLYLNIATKKTLWCLAALD